MSNAKKMRRNQRIGFAFLYAAATLTIVVILTIVLYIFIKGVPYISWEFLTSAPKGNGTEGGIFPMIVNTVLLVGLTLLFVTPVGIGAAIYMTEYAKQGFWVKLIRQATENLSAIPSIIFGLFGFIFFGKVLGLGWSLLNGALTAAIVVLPLIVRTAEEAILSVPQIYREGSLALGASRWQTIRKVVLPAATPGILSGVVLSIGRVVGETAALLFTLGSADRMATSVMDSARSLSLHVYILAHDGIGFDQVYATSTVLIVVVLILNLSAVFLTRKRRGQ